MVYKVYARRFQPGAPPVLYLFASGFLMNSVSRLFFQSNWGFSWTLMQETPGIIDSLLICYQASTTTSQPVLDVPPTVSITDGWGTHQVEVEPWDLVSTAVEETPAPPEYVVGATGNVQPARGSAISYKALARPYDGPGSNVVQLLASCYYPTGGWHIYFTSSSEGWQLNEVVPGLVNYLITYYVAGWSSGGGLVPATTVTIRDGYGVHTVPIEHLQIPATQAASAGASPQMRV